MGKAEFLARAGTELQKAYDVDRRQFAGRAVIVARRKDFRWRWGAVRLTTAVVLGEVDDDATPAALEEFLAAAVREAASGHGVRGVQKGAAAVAVAVFDHAPPAAAEWASSAHGHKFAITTYPVAVDLSGPAVTQPTRMRIGGAFQPFLRDQVSVLETLLSAG